MDEKKLKAVTQYINKDIELTEKMLKLLEQERSALEKHDTELLGQMIEAKSLVLLELNNNQASRDTLQVTTGLPKGMDGFKQLIQSLSDTERDNLDTLTDKLTNILTKINDLSRANEKIIHMQNNQINRVLGAMHGVGEHNTYGENAQRITGGSSQSLTKA